MGAAPKRKKRANRKKAASRPKPSKDEWNPWRLRNEIPLRDGTGYILDQSKEGEEPTATYVSYCKKKGSHNVTIQSPTPLKSADIRALWVLIEKYSTDKKKK